MTENKILVLYGSETGTAQDVAECIWRDSKRLGFSGSVLPMDDYDIANLIYEPLIIFVCSTTGQGDPPTNMRKFWRFLLRKNLPSNSLANSRVAVLGLGDSSYSKFNFAAKKLSRRLNALGAKPLLETGLCDDQHDLGLDAVLIPWLKQLWDSLEILYPFINESRHNNTNSLLLRWKTNPINKVPDDIEFLPGEPKDRLYCSVYENKRITTEEHFQDVRLITFRPDTESVIYSPGAVAYVKPNNSSSSVSQLMSLIEDQVELVFQMEAVHLPLPDVLDGKVLSLKDVATKFWDLNAVPRRHVFEVLAHTTPSELEKEKLEEFLSPGGLDELYSYCNRPRRTTLEVLADFPHATANLKLDHLFEIFQPIRPRAYSICSSVEYDGPVIQILVAVVKYKTRLSTPRIGLASNWLASLSGKVCVAVKPPSLRFPKDSPVIMVGPGTGVAPFRSFISQRIAKAFAEGDRQRQCFILIFGSRYEKRDFHFGKELQKWHSSGEIYLITAFSRDQPDKVYVQHKICDEGNKIFQAIYNDDGYIFVSGSSKDMPTAVKNAFVKVLVDKGNLPVQDAETYIDRMEVSGRYQQETWS